MAPGRPLLSVVTPVLNGGEHLARCLASVERLAARFPGALEHIVADGGSTDDSFEIAAEAAQNKNSPVVRVLEGPDRGQSHAINRAVRCARGTWIGWLNADDVYAPGAAQLLGSLADELFVGVDAVVGRCRFVDAHGRSVFEPATPDLQSAEPLLRPLSGWFAGRCIVQPEVVVRREAFEAVGGLDETNHLAMDHDLWLRLHESGKTYAPIDAMVALQHVHRGQKTADNLGVARRILQNAESYLVRNPAEVSSRITTELDELSRRIAVVDSVMRTPRGSPPFGVGAAPASINAVVREIEQPAGWTLAVGSRTFHAMRSAGWDLSRVIRSDGRAAYGPWFGCAVVDCLDPAWTDSSLRAVGASLTPKGTAVFMGCATRPALERARDAVAHTLGQRVTWNQAPWSEALVAAARQIIGWARTSERSALPVDPARAARSAFLRGPSSESMALAESLGVTQQDLACTLRVHASDFGGLGR